MLQVFYYKQNRQLFYHEGTENKACFQLLAVVESVFSKPLGPYNTLIHGIKKSIGRVRDFPFQLHSVAEFVLVKFQGSTNLTL